MVPGPLKSSSKLYCVDQSNLQCTTCDPAQEMKHCRMANKKVCYAIDVNILPQQTWDALLTSSAHIKKIYILFITCTRSSSILARCTLCEMPYHFHMILSKQRTSLNGLELFPCITLKYSKTFRWVQWGTKLISIIQNSWSI